MAKHPFGEPTRVPAIPDVHSTPASELLSAIKEWIEVREGARGRSGLDKVVTFRDLLNSGVATPGAIQGLGGVEVPPIPLEPGGGDHSLIPPAVTNLVAAGAVSNIILTWDFVRGFVRFTHFEVWRSQTNNLGSAVLVAKVYEPIYVDEVGPKARFYYWVRAASDAGVGPFQGVEGVLGETAIDVEEVIDAITGEINSSGLLQQLTLKVDSRGKATGWGFASTTSNSQPISTFAVVADRFFVAPPIGAHSSIIERPLFTVQTSPTTINGVSVPRGVYMTDAFIMNGTITNAKIGDLAVDDAKIASMQVGKLRAGSLGVGNYIESTNYMSGATGWRIHANGNAEFQNATVRGTVYATAGTIGGINIQSQRIQTTNYNGSNAGWRINSDGSVHFTNGTFRGHITATSGSFSGSLNAATGTFSGSLNAATGTFAGRVHGGSFTTGSYTGYAWPAGSGTGVYLGPEGLLMGNAHTGNFFEVSATGRYLAMPGMRVDNGQMTIDAINVIDTLQLRGGAVSTTHAFGFSGTATTGTAGYVGSIWIPTPVAAEVFVFIDGYVTTTNTLQQYGTASAIINGATVASARTFGVQIGSTGGDADESIFSSTSTTGMGTAWISPPGATLSVSLGPTSTQRSGSGTVVALLLKR